MSFDARGTNDAGEQSVERKSVDWAARSAYIIEKVDAEQPETVVGTISGLIDLGIQKREPAQYLAADNEDEEVEIEKYKSYGVDIWYQTVDKLYDNGKMNYNVRAKFVPQKDIHSVTLTIDFPDIMLDQGQFFGQERGEEPYRMLLNDEFFVNGQIIVSRPLTIGMRKNDKTNNQWSIPFTNTLYKMAVAAGIVNQGEPFTNDRITELVGQSYQFEIRAYMNGNFFNEKCKYVGKVGRGQTVKVLDEKYQYVIQFNRENDLEVVNTLRTSIKNSIRNANDYEGSLLQGQMDGGDSNTTKEAVTPKPNNEKPSETSDEGFDDFDDTDLPF